MVHGGITEKLMEPWNGGKKGEQTMSRVLPILFNAEMVQAILDDRKTTTRRLAKKIPTETHRIEPLENETFECHWGGYQTDTKMFCDGSCIVTPPYKKRRYLICPGNMAASI